MTKEAWESLIKEIEDAVAKFEQRMACAVCGRCPEITITRFERPQTVAGRLYADGYSKQDLHNWTEISRSCARVILCPNCSISQGEKALARIIVQREVPEVP